MLYERADEDLYCVGNLERDKYIAVPAGKLPLVLNFVQLLDGTRSLESIATTLEQEYGQKTDVVQLYQLLSHANLIEDPAPESVFQGEFRRFSFDLLTLNTRRFFEKLQPFARQTNRALWAVGLVVVLLGIASLDAQFLSSQNVFLVGDSFLIGYAVLAAGSLLSILCHELAHAFVASAYGATARSIRMALYMGFIPYFYTEIAGIYPLKPAQRIRIWLAGSYLNLLLGCAGILLYRWAGPFLTLEARQILTKFSLANFFTILGNLSPLMPTDGYFIVSTLLKRVNIRTNALFEFLKWLRREQNRLRGWILVYFLLTSSIIVGWLLMQLYWVAGIAVELLGGRWNLAALQPQFYFLIFVGVVLVRLLGVIFLKLLKNPPKRGNARP